MTTESWGREAQITLSRAEARALRDCLTPTLVRMREQLECPSSARTRANPHLVAASVTLLEGLNAKLAAVERPAAAVSRETTGEVPS